MGADKKVAARSERKKVTQEARDLERLSELLMRDGVVVGRDWGIVLGRAAAHLRQPPAGAAVSSRERKLAKTLTEARAVLLGQKKARFRLFEDMEWALFGDWGKSKT